MITVSRKLLVTGATALVALAATACTPPHQNDSALKIETATGIAAPTTTSGASIAENSANVPGYIDCVAAPVLEPETISLNCVDNSDRLSEIEWTTWDEETATGTATRVSVGFDGTETSSESVDVELSFPTQASQGLVFSQVSVDGEPIFL